MKKKASLEENPVFEDGTHTQKIYVQECNRPTIHVRQVHAVAVRCGVLNMYLTACWTRSLVLLPKSNSAKFGEYLVTVNPRLHSITKQNKRQQTLRDKILQP